MIVCQSKNTPQGEHWNDFKRTKVQNYLQKRPRLTEKDGIRLIECKQFYQHDDDNRVYDCAFHRDVEIGQQHDDGEQRHAFHRHQEQPGPHPLFVFFPVEEHPVDESVGQGLGHEIQNDSCGINANNLIVLQDEDIGHIGA